MIKVGLDIDGVLADLVWTFTGLAHERYKTPQYPIGLQPVWAFKNILSNKQSDKIWRTLDENPGLWASAHIIPTEPEMAYLLTLPDIEFFYITNRPEASADATARWLRENNFPNRNNLFLTPNKEDVINANDIQYMLDDRPRNIFDIEEYCPGCIPMVRDWLYNRDETLNGITRVASLSEYIYQVRQMEAFKAGGSGE